MNMDNILFELNKLRFGKLIIYNNPQNQYYGLVKNEYFDDKDENGKLKFDKAKEEYFGRSDEVQEICHCCEVKQKDNFELKIVSHGCHSLDLFKKQNLSERDYSNYHNDGIMLIMESPSANLDACYKKDFSGKHPAKVWWWLEAENTNSPAYYPNEFSSKKYGQFFNSLVHTFKLKNAYMTNFIKCGLLDNNGNFGQFDAFSDSCKNNCFENILLEEIKIIKPKVIFVFSTNVCNFLIEHMDKIKEKLGNKKPFIIQLPHPARSRSGFSDEYYRTLWYCRVLEGLIKSGIVQDKAEQNRYWNDYVLYPQDYVYYIKNKAQKYAHIYPKNSNEAQEFKKENNNQIKFQGEINYNKEKYNYDIIGLDKIDKKEIKQYIQYYVNKL